MTDKVLINIPEPQCFDYSTDFPFDIQISKVEISDQLLTMTYVVPAAYTLLEFVQQVRQEVAAPAIKAVTMHDRQGKPVYAINYRVSGYAGFKTVLRAFSKAGGIDNLVCAEISFHATPIWPEPRSN